MPVPKTKKPLGVSNVAPRSPAETLRLNSPAGMLQLHSPKEVLRLNSPAEVLRRGL